VRLRENTTVINDQPLNLGPITGWPRRVQ
jgi:hypothetical protein